MDTKYSIKTLGQLTSFISKGIAPRYARFDDNNVIRVLNQRCNRNNEISLANSRLNNLSKRKVPSEKILKDNDVLINSTGVGTAGRVAQIRKVNKSLTVDGHMIIMRPIKDIDPVFYGYAIIANQYKIEQLAEGSTGQTEINRQRLLNEITLKVPSVEEQKRLADDLLNIDYKIKVNKQINANLLDFTQTFFKKKFDIEGKIPLSNYFLPKRGKNLLKKNVIKGSVPVVAGGLKPAAYHNSSNTEAPVITISASGANAGYVQIWGDKVWSSDSSYIDSSLSKNIYFWFLFLKSKQKQIFDSQTGSAQPHIYPKHIGNILVPKLHENEIQNFNKTLTPFFEKIFQNEKENMILQNVKTGLLNRYFS